MGIKKVINSTDGHVYYVVESSDRRVFMGVFYLDRYEELSNVKGQPGLWFVRNAACDDTGQHGDPTVHEGWAMYTWDTELKVPIMGGEERKGGWRKVAEQESVDGPWGIDERILKQLVKKTEYNLKIAEIEGRITDVEELSKQNAQDIDNLQESVADLEAKKHWHDNKTDLDALIEKHGQLTFQGTPISGNTFLYDNVIDGKLMWKDPTDPEAEATEVANSLAIANAFITTPMAWAGMILQVMEVDGSFTTFVAIKTSEEGIRRNLKYLNQIKSDRKYYDYTVEVDGYTEIQAAEATRIITEGEEGHDLFFTERKLAIVPYTTTTADSRGSIIFVDTLPTNSVVYDGRGVWYPMYDDGVYAPNQPYISINGSWKEVISLDGSGSTKAVPGAKFTLAYCDDDPQMPFKRNHLFWSEPVDSESFKAWWKESVIVRKFGSAPNNVNDGEKILTITSRTTGSDGFVDTCPYSNENVYYRLFSYTRGGSLYANTDVVSPEPITWNTFFNIANKGMLNNVFKVGDTITLPKHPLFGNIDCEVISITEATDTTKGCVRVATKDALGHLAFGSTNAFEGSDLETWLNDTFYMYTALKLTTDGVAQPRITYYVFDGTFKPLNIAVGAAFPEGVDVYQTDTEHPEGLFTSKDIPSVDETLGFDNITKEKHYNHLSAAVDWWTRDALDANKVRTGNGASVVPTSTLGAVVVFTLQET